VRGIGASEPDQGRPSLAEPLPSDIFAGTGGILAACRGYPAFSAPCSWRRTAIFGPAATGRCRRGGLVRVKGVPDRPADARQAAEPRDARPMGALRVSRIGRSSQGALESAERILALMPARTQIDFISDVSCPWCAIALHSLEAALSRLGTSIDADLRFQPFELNPAMGPGGQDIVEHLSGKYGSSAAEIERSQELIRARGAEVGFTFDMAKRTRIYNTLDAHRLLHWAALEGRQRALEHALFAAYFTEGRDPSDHALLLELAARVGLDTARAAQILASDEYAREVRAREQLFQDRGIHAVPAIIIDDRYLVQGGQPVHVFEDILRRCAAEEIPATEGDRGRTD
jgi:predicted DsbA family dithiol-disulfide isomerase